ncbi:MAG: winged helix-turn-helix transcriptional regulator [Deltaproteobacteria bacterium]|nr:winged helix-turn-helix transcriptional regulator [Deltaproteobacteria bacterium]
MEETLLITKALSDGTRLRIISALKGGELCVCQVVELLKLAPSTVSRHLHILSASGLIRSRKDTRWVYYRLADAGSPKKAARALKWVQGALEGDASIIQDSQALKKITRVSREALCRTQGKR